MFVRLDPPSDGPINMAADLSLLNAAQEGKTGCRIYSWSETWVTLGRAQNPEETLVAPGQTKWIRRPTGGAAVLHGHDLTVGLAFPLRHSVRDSYRVAGMPLVRALTASGVEAVLAEEIGADRGDPRRIDCFAGSSANDIVNPFTRAKVCGCALRRTRSAVLIQASIPIGEPLLDPAEVIHGGVRIQPASLDRREFVTALEEELVALVDSLSVL